MSHDDFLLFCQSRPKKRAAVGKKTLRPSRIYLAYRAHYDLVNVKSVVIDMLPALVGIALLSKMSNISPEKCPKQTVTKGRTSNSQSSSHEQIKSNTIQNCCNQVHKDFHILYVNKACNSRPRTWST